MPSRWASALGLGAAALAALIASELRRARRVRARGARLARALASRAHLARLAGLRGCELVDDLLGHLLVEGLVFVPHLDRSGARLPYNARTRASSREKLRLRAPPVALLPLSLIHI